MWQRDLDPFIEVISTATTAFLPIILKIPGLRTSIHISIYFPTHGKDGEFVSDLAELRNCLDELTERFPDPVIFIRGDGNTNANNKMRVTLLKQLIVEYKLMETELGHSTYHHFVGNGNYDSMIDILLHSDIEHVNEAVTSILCVHDHPELLSHHDVIMSNFTIPTYDQPPITTKLVAAPRCDHTRTKINWSDEGKVKYADLVGPYLREAREKWLNSSSQTSMSVLLSLTNSIMSKCACQTNDFKIVGQKLRTKSRKIPLAIKCSRNKMITAHKKLKTAEKLLGSKSGHVPHTKTAFICNKRKYRQVLRQYRLRDSLERYAKLDDIFVNPTSAYCYLRQCRKSKATQIEHLSVGDKVYAGSAVCDGFYDSMTSLKQCDMEQLRNDPHLSSQFTNYEHIMKISQDQPPIPPISLEKSTNILKDLKKNVNDFYSITALHYLNAGHEGIVHYNELLNAIILDVNNANIEELNVAHGNILYKGHKKDKHSERSYRTISTCPFLAKSVDCYFRDLYLDKWSDCQAATQYQGTGSSHELASLLVTEVIQHSLYTANKPVFLLALDAQSAFDRCLRQILSCELYKAGVPGSAILFMDNRLASRQTVYEWDGVKMGPATDSTGFEQGGINSSDFYKLYNNDQLVTAQSSNFGADIGSDVISGVGQADDVMLLSNDIFELMLLVMLTEQYCQKYRVKLEPKKTKLLGFSHNKQTELLVKHAASTNLITINSTPVEFTNMAEHVGVVRHTDGNMPNIIHRVSQHKKAIGSVLSAGLARGHRGSPAAALKVHQLYCTPRLFSGLATLVLSKSETGVIDSHYQNSLQHLQRLHAKTPRPVIFFLAGRVPGEAELHLRQLSLFSMICHLPDDPLHKRALYALTNLPPSSRSWFHQVRNLCLQYGLPHPLILLETPLSKEVFKKLVKHSVNEYWQDILATESFSLDSLRYFDPRNASLLHPHPIWTSVAGNSYECSKSTILARMVSGRYRSEMMCRFWSSNSRGHCLAETCDQVLGTLEHLLVSCPALDHTRHRLHSLWCRKTVHLQPLHNLILQVLGSTPEEQVSFILDCMSNPTILQLVQLYGQTVEEVVLYLTRTWAFSIHRQKMILLGRWPPGGSQTTPNNQPQILTDSNNFDNTDNKHGNNPCPILTLNQAITNELYVTGNTIDMQNQEGPTGGTSAPPPTPPTSDVSQLVPVISLPSQHVQNRDQSPTGVPKPAVIPSSAEEGTMMGPGQGGGLVAPGGRLNGSGVLQMPASSLLSTIFV